MNSTGKISVIIPCYNGERFLSQALESLLWQTYQEWECILIDDGSTDHSREIFHRYAEQDHRFIYLSQRNSGPSVARNKGIDRASGDFIQFLDADDILPKERFARCISNFIAEPESDVVYTEYSTFNERNSFTRTIPSKLPQKNTFRAFLLDHNRTFNAVIHEFLFRKEVISRHKFDESLPIYCEDIECWIRIADSGARFSYIDEVLALYRFAGASLSSQEVNVHSAKLLILERYRQHPQIVGVEKELKSTVDYFRERLVIAYFMERSFKKGWSELRIQWSASSRNGRIKMLLWFVSMLIMSKERLAQIRAAVVKYTPLQWGGWSQYAEWTPPQEIIDLVRRT